MSITPILIQRRRKLCLCGCGGEPTNNHNWLTGHNLKTHRIGGRPKYADGYRYCTRCEKYYKTDKIFCSSMDCHQRLRSKTRSARCKRKTMTMRRL